MYSNETDVKDKEDTISKNFNIFFLHPSILFYISVESSAFTETLCMHQTLYTDLTHKMASVQCIFNSASVYRTFY
jgi:hypothetical protein